MTYQLFCVIDLRSSSNEYVCDQTRPCTSNEQYLDTNDTLVISGMSNDVCDRALVEKTVINADKNETHNNKCKYYRYIGDFLEEDWETPRRRKLFWNTHTKILDEKNQKKRLLEQKNRRLESKISSLNTLVDELKKECQLNASYSHILKNIGTEEEKQLLMRQLQISTGKSICPILRKFAMTLHFYSPSAYSYVRTIFSKALPDVSTIRKWYSKLDGLPGMTKESFQAISLKVKEMKVNGKQLYGCLVMDEMSIKQHVHWTGTRHQGYIDFGLGGKTEEMDNLPYAKDAFVIMVVGINTSWKVPIAYYLINGISAEEKANIILNCLQELDTTGVIIKTLTFDGAANNLSMASELEANLQYSELKPYFLHPNTNDKKLPWRLEDINGSGLHSATKLRNRHIYYFREKMKVRLAVQTFSTSVANAILFCMNDLKLDNFQGADATIEFCLIQTSNPEAYRTLVHYLRNEKAEFHTFQLKEDKPMRIVIRNLHPSTSTEMLKNELEHRLYEPTDHSKEIFKLESILHAKIKIEEPHKPKIISLCQNCQAYGHTKAYCGYSPRCVRCGDDHSSSACPNSRQDPMRCALCTDAEKAEVFQAHLSETFYPHEDIHIPQHIIDVGNYLHSTFPSARPEKYFTPNEVKSMISNCSRKKSPGFDLITANDANCLPNKAFILLTYIYNAILRLSYFSTLWKFSQIIMVAKPDKPPDLPTSYRPISLLLYFSKICERLILKRIYPHIISKNVLLSSQFGFRAKHSTVHQVHRAIDAISTSLENKCYCTCAFLDISQAFDKVWHEGLLFKLRKFLPTTLFLLMESYLTDRHFQIRQGSATSNIATISAGVPQGGVLSPILFNIYAADQPSTQNTIVADYADDKVILSVHNDPIIASRNLQSHLNLLSKCFIMNPPAKSSLSPSHIKNTKNNLTIHPIKIVKSNDNTNNWQTVPIRSPSTPTSPNPIIQKTNSFSSKNRFSALATNEISYEISNEVEMLSQEISNVQPKIPPIYIKDDIDFFDFCKKIKPFTDPDGFNTKSSSSGLKLMTYSINAYRHIIKFLEINNMNFHNYQTNEEKAFRVVIRHLHHTTPTDYIKEELHSLGFITRSITNCLQYKTKNPLPLFFVDLEPSPSNHNIYKVDSICYTKIKIEAPHPKKNPVQRLRCQNYGHTRTYCHHTPRCVKRCDIHLSFECQKDSNTPATCALCSGDHPASYKGCPKFKLLQKGRSSIKTNRPTETQDSSSTSIKTNTIQENTFPHFVNPNGAPLNLPQYKTSPIPTHTLKKIKIPLNPV
ncbi:hypothetical protein QTP88_027448 [Uroleucon formosanum]